MIALNLKPRTFYNFTNLRIPKIEGFYYVLFSKEDEKYRKHPAEPPHLEIQLVNTLLCIAPPPPFQEDNLQTGISIKMAYYAPCKST